ncbi:hypothetical protein P691DRAFT_689516, partial [Macrolepiota fuliginosa MF-IS2]
TKGGSYILAELDGSISKLHFAAYCLAPYHPQDIWAIPLTKFTDTMPEQLNNLTYDIETPMTPDLVQQEIPNHENNSSDEYQTL